ncbi:MAG: YqhA family protein [Burkholderiales bacterium]|nr:YqhA family protein [Burkholderiales bacterium]
MKWIEILFEGALWRSRFVVVFAVIASIAAGFSIFYMATVDVVYLVAHILHYADPGMAPEARRVLHEDTITHLVEVVDGYLLATVMLIFSLGLYELFVSDIDEAKGEERSSKILVIESLDDLKARLAKVILMILIVTLFEQALKIRLATPLDLLYLGGAIALVGLSLYLTHAAESKPKVHEEH